MSQRAFMTGTISYPARCAVWALACGLGLLWTTHGEETNAVARLKHPISWLTWGMDWRWREEYYHNARTLGGYVPGYSDNEHHYQRYRTRLWATISPAPELDFDGGAVWEFRTYLEPQSEPFFTPNEIFTERLAVRLKELGPFQLTVGRQNLHFGNRWLIWDGTPRDGSRTDCFDAARLTWTWPGLHIAVDVIYFDLRADSDSRLPRVNPYEGYRYLIEQNERGLILYVQNRALPDTQLDAYGIYRHQSPVPYTEETDFASDGGDGYLFGARAEGRFSECWRYRTEFAVELGRKNARGMTAFGINSQLSYCLNDAWNNTFRIVHEYLSGDDPDSPTDEGWDPMWGRRGSWSSLMVQTLRVENGDRPGYWTNLQRVGTGWGVQPTRRAEMQWDYMAVFANSNPLRGQPGYSANGRFRGHLFAGLLKFTINQHLAGHLRGECLLPGDYYADDRRHAAFLFRAELLLSL